MTRITTSTFGSVLDEFRRDPFNVGFDNLFDRLIDFQSTINPPSWNQYRDVPLRLVKCGFADLGSYHLYTTPKI